MHRRATTVRDLYRACTPRSPSTHSTLPTTRYFPAPTYTVVTEAEHELWHPDYLQAIKTALDRLEAPLSK